MRPRPFFMERWLMANRFHVRYNLAESGVSDLTLNELISLCDIDLKELMSIKLKDEDTRGSEALREEISSLYPGRRAEEVMVTTGTSEALFILFHLLLNPGDTCVVTFPAFQGLYETARSLSCRIKFWELRIEEGFVPDLNRLADLMDDRTRLVVVNTPHNPTGKIIPMETLSEVHRLCRERGAYLLMDEHYRFLPLNGSAGILPSAVTLGGDVIGTGSIVKCFGLMGLRMGWMVAPLDLLSAARDFKDYLTHTLSPISDFLSLKALRNREAILSVHRSHVLKNAAALNQWMRGHEAFFGWTPPEGGVVSYPRILLDMDADRFCQDLIDRQGVFLLPAGSFEMEGHVRIGFGIRHDAFLEALDRLDRYLKDM
ncbi:MAG: aspartate aminotransferase [Nitrospirae bacterium CG17_big_fil_post_rev_8_21_14_2_50_50_9]|nr:MAG: aspartate aminotransferase [Nitrospirae bacterium CG17_big_fil_post_rev_8_21_14_2_50_50_9]